MMPLSHAMSDGEEADLDAPSELTPGVASSMKSLRNMRRWVSLPPCRVVRSADENSPFLTWPLTTWYEHTSADSTPPASSNSSTTESVGTKTVMSGWLRSTTNEAHAAANFLYASWPLTSDSSFIGSCSGPSGPHRMSGPGRVLHVSPTVAMLMALARVVGAVPTIRPEEKVPAIASMVVGDASRSA